MILGKLSFVLQTLYQFLILASYSSCSSYMSIIGQNSSIETRGIFKLLIANPTKWSTTLNQFFFSVWIFFHEHSRFTQALQAKINSLKSERMLYNNRQGIKNVIQRWVGQLSTTKFEQVQTVQMELSINSNTQI